jgi:hypothetical protein
VVREVGELAAVAIALRENRDPARSRSGEQHGDLQVDRGIEDDLAHLVARPRQRAGTRT